MENRIVKKYVNLTPHEINIYDGEEIVRSFPPSGIVARVKNSHEYKTCFEDPKQDQAIPVHEVGWGEVENLPAPENGTIYIVSFPVLNAVKRDDVVAPNTTPKAAIRDKKNGHILGVTGFQIPKRSKSIDVPRLRALIDERVMDVLMKLKHPTWISSPRIEREINFILGV